MVEAGEVLIRVLKLPRNEYLGVYRPVPLALEIIEADRLAGDKDTYAARLSNDNGNRIIRGVEIDDLGKPVAYWVYKDHPLNRTHSLARLNESQLVKSCICSAGNGLGSRGAFRGSPLL